MVFKRIMGEEWNPGVEIMYERALGRLLLLGERLRTVHRGGSRVKS